MKPELKNSIFAGLTFGILMIPFLAIFYRLPLAIIVGPIAGFAFGYMLYSFMNSEAVKQQTKLNSHEAGIIYSGGANHFVGKESVGGKLYLLEDRLKFKSHNFNIQNHEMLIELKDIDEIGFYRPLGITTNGLVVTKKDGKEERFVVNNRKIWKEKIKSALDKIIKF